MASKVNSATTDISATRSVTEKHRLFLVAGEPSGDRIGGALLTELAKTVSLEASGVGGADMMAAGLTPLFDMSEISVMGYVDVLFALPRLLARLDQVVRAARAFTPDAVILIDSQAFSRSVARRLKRAGYRGAVFLYVAPAVYAWKPGGARKIAPLYDEVLAVLPFEPKTMAELGGPPTYYVGHPAEHLIGTARRKGKKGLVALLPGSRKGELDRHLPLFAEVVARLAGHPRIEGFALPTLASLADRIEKETAGWAAPVAVVTTPEDRRNVFTRARLALASAGTVTLELAMMDVPMVNIYIPDWPLMLAYLYWGKPLVSLPDIILNERLIAGVPPGRNHAERVAAEMVCLLEDDEARARQREGFARIRDKIVNGLPEIGRTSAAERVLKRLAG